ncbi:unnamed protein product [Lathyrus sativus]|nr:unnamed protein product [Lathyrus sativus]
MYICFKGPKDIFFKCKPIIGLNGCFLKNYYGGQIIEAIRRDLSDQMLRITYVVVKSEAKYSWNWFLKLLANDLEGVRLCKTYTFIGNHQKGLFLALEEFLRQSLKIV